jgi:hypothetical protein
VRDFEKGLFFAVTSTYAPIAVAPCLAFEGLFSWQQSIYNDERFQL